MKVGGGAISVTNYPDFLYWIKQLSRGFLNKVKFVIFLDYNQEDLISKRSFTL